MQRVFYAQALVLAIIAVMYFYFGLHERFFWTVFGWDILLHLLGGLWVGLAAAFALGLMGIRASAWQLIAAAVIAGVLWELFEYALGIGGSVFMSYGADTAKDLVDDLLGGIGAAFIFKRL